MVYNIESIQCLQVVYMQQCTLYSMYAVTGAGRTSRTHSMCTDDMCSSLCVVTLCPT